MQQLPPFPSQKETGINDGSVCGACVYAVVFGLPLSFVLLPGRQLTLRNILFFTLFHPI